MDRKSTRPSEPSSWLLFVCETAFAISAVPIVDAAEFRIKHDQLSAKAIQLEAAKLETEQDPGFRRDLALFQVFNSVFYPSVAQSTCL